MSDESPDGQPDDDLDGSWNDDAPLGEGGPSRRLPIAASDTAVATGHPQTVALPARYLIVVTVRDRAGSPLEEAPVTFTTDGSAIGTATTDATGLVPPRLVAPRALLEISATFPAPPPDAEPTPGGFGEGEDEARVSLDLDQLAALAVPLNPGPEHPTFDGVERVKGVVYLTLQPVLRYYPRHLFPWQNKILRQLIYRKDEQGPSDQGRTRSGTGNAESDADVKDTQDRKERLRDFIAHYRLRVADAASIDDFRRRHRSPKPDTSPHETSDATPHELAIEADRKAKQERLEQLDRADRIDARLSWLKNRIARRPKNAVAGATRSAPRNARDKVGHDVAAGENARAELATPEGSPDALPPIRTDDDVHEYEDLTQRKALLGETSTQKTRLSERRKIQEELKKTGKRLERAAYLALTHGQLLTYIHDEIFAKDPSEEVIPGWVRYAVLHYSGLRYAGAHNAYYPPHLLVLTLRAREIDEREIPTAGALDPQRIAIHVQALRALLTANPDLSSRAFKGSRTKARPSRTNPLAPLVEAETALANHNTAAAANVVRHLLHNLAIIWTERMDDPATTLAALSPPLPEVPYPSLPQREAWGLLVRWRDTGKLPAEAWPGVVQYTELRNDFVNVAEVTPTKSPKPPAAPQDQETGGETPPPSPAASSGRWPVRAPSLEGKVVDENPTLAWLFREKAQQKWKSKQKQDLGIVTSRAVCNQITEMVAAARNVQLDGGLTANAGYDYDDREADDDEEARASQDSAASLASRFRLFRPKSQRDLQPGDVMLFLTWRQIGSKDDPWSLVSLRTPMPMRVGLLDHAPVDGRRGPAMTTQRHEAEISAQVLDAVLQHGTSDTALRFVEEHELKRGRGIRPSPLPRDALGTRTPGLISAQDQLGVARTLLSGASKNSAALKYMLVRRRPDAVYYNEVLAWAHAATVIDIPPKQGDLIAVFETNEPTGINIRPWRAYGHQDPERRPYWDVVYGRPARATKALSHLAYYLDRSNLLYEAHLPPDEDG
ncbi:Ig-like domain-containing protein [Chondromyces crocatus]|uniref:Uncharacterized protein n=1 Tax=Chondromyces crocatus TaxID=52 RepID=A0A0K1ESW0_CHOCO|nr:Ig-like domain-containing protein [Chondromyces crocatus]AKT43727.1 uncharacterized protein CMC5_079620 [Chondromyces crocatus]